MTSLRLTYVPEIDGLRALAVMAVILFHLQVAGLSGGFVGVDVFFVISGFLITSGLRRELDEHGVVRFKRFYLRRARRLLPALYAVLAVSSIAATACLSHHRLPEYGASQIAAALSLSNISFYLGSGYFDTASDYKPLLHTWSLGVEEQFYLLWPALMWGAWHARRHFLLLATLLFVATLGLSEYLVRSEPSAAFFLVPFRMYEFVIGAVLAMNVVRLPTTAVRSDAALLIGISAIVAAVLSFGPRSPFPGMRALLPCIGAALVLWGAPSSRFAWMLNNRVASYLGRTSYSTYLVHWPLIVFYRVAKVRAHLLPREQVILFCATLLLGHLCHRWIENRYRSSSTCSDRRFLVWLIASTAVLIGVGWGMQQQRLVQMRSWVANYITTNEVLMRRDERFSLRRKVCAVKGWNRCDDPIPGKRNGLVIGDSHAIDAYNAFVTMFPADNVNLSDLGGCPPHPSIDTIVLANHPDLLKCLALNRKRYDETYLHRFDYIVINVLMDWYDQGHLSNYLQFLHDHGVRKVIVFGQTWRAHDDVPELVNRVGFDRDRLMALLVHAPDDHLVEETAKRLGYLYVSKTEALSTNGRFDVFDTDGILFTYDQHHLSLAYSKRLLDRRFNEVRAYLTEGMQATK